MEDMRRIAFENVARGVGFGALAIVVTMIGFSYDMLLSIKVGGVLFALTAAILVLRAQLAPRKPYRTSDVWRALPRERRPPEAHAQWAATTALQEAYYTFARHTAAVSVALGTFAILLTAVRGVGAF